MDVLIEFRQLCSWVHESMQSSSRSTELLWARLLPPHQSPGLWLFSRKQMQSADDPLQDLFRCGADHR